MEGMLFNGSRYEGTTFDWLGNFWGQGGKLVDEAGWRGKPYGGAPKGKPPRNDA